MKNLMTRKLLFGMLMVLVLAFSVQGIAEALMTVTRKSSDDLETRSPGDDDDFRISFTVWQAWMTIRWYCRVHYTIAVPTWAYLKEDWKLYHSI